MQGSCAAPEHQIWSLYSPQTHMPQAITAWKRNGPASLAPPLICGADLNLGDKLVNCFSFACTPAGSIRGVPVATCFCPLGESLDGTRVQRHTAFATQAGQRNQEICSEFPVAAPIPSIPELSH
jgi:hypothetical protein